MPVAIHAQQGNTKTKLDKQLVSHAEPTKVQKTRVRRLAAHVPLVHLNTRVMVCIPVHTVIITKGILDVLHVVQSHGLSTNIQRLEQMSMELHVGTQKNGRVIDIVEVVDLVTVNLTVGETHVVVTAGVPMVIRGGMAVLVSNVNTIVHGKVHRTLVDGVVKQAPTKKYYKIIY